MGFDDADIGEAGFRKPLPELVLIKTVMEDAGIVVVKEPAIRGQIKDGKLTTRRKPPGQVSDHLASVLDVVQHHGEVDEIKGAGRQCRILREQDGCDVRPWIHCLEFFFERLKHTGGCIGRRDVHTMEVKAMLARPVPAP